MLYKTRVCSATQAWSWLSVLTDITQIDKAAFIGNEVGHKLPINQFDSDRPNATRRHLHAIRGSSVTVGHEVILPFTRVLSSEFA